MATEGNSTSIVAIFAILLMTAIVGFLAYQGGWLGGRDHHHYGGHTVEIKTK